MGEDLCLVVLTRDRKRKLNWKAGEKLIKDMYKGKEDDDEDEDGFGEGELSKDDLLGSLEEIQNAYNEGSRDIDIFNIGHLELIVSGGMTYGDAPTDFFNAVSNLPPEVFEAVGLNVDENYINYRAILLKILKHKTIAPMLPGIDKTLDKMIKGGL